MSPPRPPGTAPGRLAAAALAAVAALAVLAAAAPAAAVEAPRKARFEAFADRTAYPAGSEARIAGVMRIEEHWHVNAAVPTLDYLIPTTLTLTPPAGWPAPAVDYPEPVRRTFAFAGEPLDVYEGRVVLLARVTVPAGTAEGRYPVAARLRYQACDDDSCLPPVTADARVEIVVGRGGKAQHPEVFAETAGGGAMGGGTAGGGAAALGGRRFALMLLLGALGGLILNVMPCVLPVLSLKVFGLVQAAGQGRAQVVTGSLATTAGILASFWALALFAVAARAAGAAVGWGVQFQEPAFVAFLAVVVVLFSLNLWGLFEVPLPARLAGALGGGGPREGFAGHFASGLFATLMATPCSAPFLGTALGFALAQTAPVILATFTAVGLGMALPYLVLAVAPGAARLLPRPGAWMEHTKKLMGFLLAASAVWLFYVLAGQVSPERLAAIELGLVALALFVWLRGRVLSAGALRHAAAAGVAVATAATLIVAGGAEAGAVGGRGGEAGGLIAWQAFDRARAEELAASGALVFVDVTADWCFTCKTNERLVLETPEIAALFSEHAVVPMKADWTNQDPAIAAFLADHGRYSIPFYLLYRPGAEPLPFSELLTKPGLSRAVSEAASQTARLD